MPIIDPQTLKQLTLGAWVCINNRVQDTQGPKRPFMDLTCRCKVGPKFEDWFFKVRGVSTSMGIGHQGLIRKICRCSSIRFSNSPTPTQMTYTTKLVLHLEIHVEASTKSDLP